jgi:5-methylcytosine-specific restriction endonuclease McrA
MGAVHEVFSLSISGSTKWCDSIYFEIINSKTYASYVLLKNYYSERDLDNLNSPSYNKRRSRFSRRYLLKLKTQHGSITCTYCKKPNLKIQNSDNSVSQSAKATIDHIIPVSKGGNIFDEDNIVACCGKCNSKKGSLSVEEFLKIVKPYKNI